MAKTVFEIDIETAGAVASAKDLREQFNILEDKMFELAAAGKEGTKEFAAIRNQLAGTKERIDDLNESIDMLKPEAKFQAFANLGAGIANGFAAAQGAAQLFGSENEALNESLTKVQSAMALAQGVQGLAGMGDSLKVVGNIIKTNPLMLLATVVISIGTALFALKDKIAIVGKAFDFLGGILDTVVGAVKDFTDWIGISSFKADEAHKKLMENAEAAKTAINERYDAEIRAAKRAGKETENIEEQKLRYLYLQNFKQIQALKERGKQRTDEENKQLIELTKQNKDYYQQLLDLDDAQKDKAKEKNKKYEEDRQKEREYWRKRRLEEQAAEQFFSDELAEEEKNKRLAREKAIQNELELNAKQNDEFNYKLYQEQKKRDEDLLLNKQKAKEQEVQLTLQGLTAIQGLADSFAGKSTESQKRAFQIKKAASLAQATIETYQAAQSAYASQMTIPTPDAPIRANIAAAIAIASGLARVAVIAKQKFEAPSTSGGGGGGGALGSFSQGGGGQPPQGLTAQNTVTQLNPDGTVAGQGERNAAPMKAYVVESESRAVTERVNKLSNNSKIG